MRKNIIIVVPSSHYGGGESYIYNLTLYLERLGIEVYLFSACRKLNNDLRPYTKDIISIDDCVSLSFNTAKLIIKINNFIVNNGINYVLLNGLPEIGIYAKFIKCKNIYSIGHSNEFWISERTKLFSKRFLRSIITHGYGKALKGVIGINKLAVHNISHNAELKNKVKLIYNGVSSIDVRDKDAHSKYIHFGRISRMVDGKGNDILLKAFSSIIKKHANVKLVLSGDGPDLHNLKLIANSLGLTNYIKFTGFIPAEDFFSQIDCMISPSLMEATPMVILEAFSCKVPVLSSNVGGVPDIITHLKTGYLFKANCELELFNAMEFFIEKRNEFHEIAKNSYNEYLLKYNLDVMGKETVNFIFNNN
ncbi:glycosyltransferase family 4 protein [Vibrio metschnikovii]|uniref:glycosyltransferase family 4 protein n=1 Tax=Vibrio metschnikovii TaxID=28172 RepID=UPI00287AAAB6|nr:glycosyltransferase family 4 protein [Vibrio metschnikovii]ELF5343573.1 glycosyltransferase family 4 protein [Vibrio metschnikovii]